MWARLEKVYQNAERITIDKNSKIVCMSDCHRGVGDRGDNFLPNQNLFFTALRYYYDKCFAYFELGDGDELWENRKLSKIVEIHSDAYWMMSKFSQEGRFRMLYGNHDCQKKYNKEFFPGMCTQEGILLTDNVTGHEILLLHGHQGDLLNDTFWKVASFLVRFVWKPLELLGVEDPTSAAHNYKKCKKTEQRLDAFSRQKGILVMAGHTHRSILPAPGESLYLNDGCCVHPRCITAIELENEAITLVKWCVTVRRDSSLAVSREVLEGPIPWNRYWDE